MFCTELSDIWQWQVWVSHTGHGDTHRHPGRHGSSADHRHELCPPGKGRIGQKCARLSTVPWEPEAPLQWHQKAASHKEWLEPGCGPEDFHCPGSCEQSCMFSQARPGWSSGLQSAWFTQHPATCMCSEQAGYTQGETWQQNGWLMPLGLDGKCSENAWGMNELLAVCTMWRQHGQYRILLAWATERRAQQKEGLGREVGRIGKALWCNLDVHVWPLPIKNAFSWHSVFPFFSLTTFIFISLYLLKYCWFTELSTAPLNFCCTAK